MANLVDSLTAIRHLVIERQELTLAQVYDVLSRDFDGFEGLRTRLAIVTPKYGNALEEPDRLAA